MSVMAVLIDGEVWSLFEAFAGLEQTGILS
jgi:hypothetical protein